MTPTTWADATMATTSIITAIAAIGIVLQLVLNNKQMHRDFETLYLQRFWSLQDEIQQQHLKSTTVPPYVIRKYLELTEDQIALRAHARITSHTWQLWAPDIYRQCITEPYSSTLDNEPIDRFQNIRTLIQETKINSTYDPLKYSRIRKFFAGL